MLKSVLFCLVMIPLAMAAFIARFTGLFFCLLADGLTSVYTQLEHKF